MHNTISLLLILSCLLLGSCVNHKDLVNYQDGTLNESVLQIANVPVLKIQPNDVLDIKVHTLEAETAAPFNLIPLQAMAGAIDIATLQLNGYLVDQDGYIDFPVIGRLKVGGLSIEAIKEMILEELDTYLKNPVVNVRLLNFRVTVSGEVTNPGSFSILNDRVTLPEAISMSGDFTPYANRKRVLVVREENGQRTFLNMNMLSADVFQSEAFYLRQNDLIYVEPLKARTGAIRDQGDETLTFIATLLTIAALVVGFTR